MRDKVAQLAHTAESQFHFTHGRLSLSFVGTLGARRTATRERLNSAADLARWCVEAGLLTETPNAGVDDLHEARSLRTAIDHVVTTRLMGGQLGADKAIVNRAAAANPPRPSLDATGRTAHRWAEEPLKACLAQVARDAIELLTDGTLTKVKECANPDCHALFIDNSRPGRRRWCSMDRCGNQAKQATRRARTQH